MCTCRHAIEIVPELAEHARRVLKAEGYDVNVRTGDGYKGWPDEAPFDVVMVTCAPEDVPRTLVDQLAEGGRMILPAGRVEQHLLNLKTRDRTFHPRLDEASRDALLTGWRAALGQATGHR